MNKANKTTATSVPALLNNCELLFWGLLFKIINYQSWQLPISPTPLFLSHFVSFILNIREGILNIREGLSAVKLMQNNDLTEPNDK